MDAQSEQIIKDIQTNRERLGDNLAELENKMRDVTNWRSYFSRNPWLAMGAAAASGLLMAAILIPPRPK